MWHGGLSKLSVLMQICVLQERQSSRLCEDFLPLLQFTEIQLRSEIVTVRFMNHRCRVSQNQWYVEPAPEVQLDSSKVWLCKKALQALKISPQAWGIQSTQNINDMSYDQLRYPMYVKKRTQRLDDWILDDVVGTGPEEQLMSDFEHMKTSLCLTDVVVLLNDRDAVNLLGLEITKTSRSFEVKNSTDVESLVNLYGLENSKPPAHPSRRSTVMELSTAIPLDGHGYSNFRTASGKLIFMAPWRPDTHFAIQQLSRPLLNPATDSKRAVKQLIRCLKGAHNTCLRLEPHMTVQKGLI